MKTAHILALILFATTTTAAARPLYGQWGLDIAGMDRKTSPGDDFFRYANGRWLDTTRIPADKPGYSLRLQMSDRTEARLHALMMSGAKLRGDGLAAKVGAFYAAFMDKARIETLGAAPLGPLLSEIRATSAREELAALMGRSNSDLEGTLFNFWVDVDLKDPKHYAVYLSQAGLGLPDRDYYLKPEFAAQKAKYQAYVAQLLRLAGWSDPDSYAKAIVEFETRVADASWTRAEQRDADKTYNPMGIGELLRYAPGFAWREFLEQAGLDKADKLIVAERTAFPKLAAIFATTRVDTLQAWQAFHVADNAAPYLSRRFANAWFEMHDKTLSGQKEQRARWKRAVTAVAGGDFLVGDRFGSFGTMGWGVGRLYVAKYFPPSAKAKIEQLVANLKAAYRKRLERLDWMSDATRAEAIRKLDTYTIKVGYPDHWRDYSALAIDRHDLLGDVRRAGAADWAFYSGRLFSPVDRSDWIMTPQTNDAYNGNLRDIAFPAGILQAPMFDAAADPAINYGAIGAVIGHELTHGFDDQGRKIDAEGRLRDWWTAGDADKFDARAKALGAQYSAFQPLAGVHVNGDLTMGENIADLGGLTLALDAYHASLHGRRARVIGGLTGDQRVFLGWAQAWRGKVTDDFVRKQVVSDPHSPRQFRVNGVVRNIDAWYAAFHVRAGDKLYVAPDRRVKIW